MNRSQLIILVVACLATLGIYQLPKAVVNKKQKSLENTAKKPSEQAKTEDAHQTQLSQKQTEKLRIWKKEALSTQSIEKKRIFADSIATLFRQVNRLDSAAYYYEQVFANQKEEKYQLIIADTWYEAFRFALSVDAERANNYGEKARTYYKALLAKNPKLYTAKANMAMTFVATATPMQGITLLREIIAEDEKNELALFNLGLLAIQSGQHDKAVARFETLLKINPQHIEAKLYLAESLLNMQEKIRAKQILTEVAELKADSLAVYRQIAKEQLDKLK